MKYCPECGVELERKQIDVKKTKGKKRERLECPICDFYVAAESFSKNPNKQDNHTRKW